MDSIKLEFKSTECRGWPTVNFLIDNDIYHDYKFSQEYEIVELPINLVDGEHQLDIEIYGKLPHNTKLDNAGNIIQDQLIELLDIYVNDIKLPNYFKYNSEYKFNDQIYKQSLLWGCNGIWSWKFSTPIITWALDFKTTQQIKYNQIDNDEITVDAHIQTGLDKTIQTLEILEKELDGLDDV